MRKDPGRGPSGPDPADDEAAFLAAYDITAWPRPSLTVDVALMTVVDGAVHILLVQRTRQPALGLWALPGGFLGLDESLPHAVERVMARETGLTGVYTAQLATFGEVDRDPRGRIVTIAYFALVPADRLAAAIADRPERVLARVETASADPSRPVALIGPRGELEPAFDHAEIVATALARVRGRIWYTPVALALMADEFTLLDLQRAYEAILGRAIDKNGFRRRILESGFVAPLGRRREGMRARPAELFRSARTSLDD